jgi:hypothetical protein
MSRFEATELPRSELTSSQVDVARYLADTYSNGGSMTILSLQAHVFDRNIVFALQQRTQRCNDHK